VAGTAKSVRNTIRFIFVSDEPTRPSWAKRPPRRPQRIGWRAIAANNRPMGRSINTFGSLEDCLADLRRLRDHVDRLRSMLAFTDGGSSWTWTLYLDDEPVATCARPASRRVEAVRAVAQFLEIVRSDPESPRQVRNLGIYGQRSQAGLAQHLAAPERS
jgi:hypothetical protein